MNSTAFYAVSCILLLAFFGFRYFQDSLPSITVAEALERIQSDSNVVVLDVRTIEEWNSETGHIANAILLPVYELDSRMQELEAHKGKTLLAICRSGNRSGKATALLQKEGFTIINISGGMLKWNAANLPVVRTGK